MTEKMKEHRHFELFASQFGLNKFDKNNEPGE